MNWALMVYIAAVVSCAAVYFKAPRQFRRYAVFVSFCGVMWWVFPEIGQSITQNVPEPVLVRPVEYGKVGNGIMSTAAPTPAPTSTPTPETPKLVQGAIWFDKPVANAEGNPKQVPGSVGGQEFTVVGRYGNPPYDGFCPCIQVTVGDDTWWVWRSVIPYTDDELKIHLDRVRNHSQP